MQFEQLRTARCCVTPLQHHHHHYVISFVIITKARIIKITKHLEECNLSSCALIAAVLPHSSIIITMISLVIITRARII